MDVRRRDGTQLSRTSTGLFIVAIIMLFCAFSTWIIPSLILSMLVFEGVALFALALSLLFGIRIGLSLIKLKLGKLDQLFAALGFILPIELFCALLKTAPNISMGGLNGATISSLAVALSLIAVVYSASIYNSVLGHFIGKTPDASPIVRLGSIVTVLLAGLVIMLAILFSYSLLLFIFAAEFALILRILAISGISHIWRVFENKEFRQALLQASAGLCLFFSRDLFAVVYIDSSPNSILETLLQALGSLLIASSMAIYHRVQTRKMSFTSSRIRLNSRYFE